METGGTPVLTQSSTSLRGSSSSKNNSKKTAQKKTRNWRLVKYKLEITTKVSAMTVT